MADDTHDSIGPGSGSARLLPTGTTDDAPLSSNSTSGAPVTCRRCGWTGVSPEARCPCCQSFLPGNGARLTHGGRALQLHGPVSSLARARVSQVRAGLVADRGGDDNGAALGILMDRAAEAVLLAETCWQNLVERGPLTSRGRIRAVVNLYLQASDRAAKYAQVLGLDRQPRSIADMSLEQWLEQERTQDAPQTAPAAAQATIDVAAGSAQRPPAACAQQGDCGQASKDGPGESDRATPTAKAKWTW